MSAEEKDFSPQALLKYCENGEVGPVDNIIANNFGAVDWVLDKNGRTALHVAARRGHPAVVSSLLTAGANPNRRNSEGSTPLHSACYRGYTDIILMLLGAGAEIDAQAMNGFTPLHAACLKKQETTVSLLLAARADSRKKNEDGLTAFDIAKYHKNDNLMTLLTNPPPLSSSEELNDMKPIVISGGGPVGLTIAAMLYEQFPTRQIFVMNLKRRWEREKTAPHFWKFRGVRRSQVVTIQNEIIDHMPKGVKAMYQNLNSFRMWAGSINVAICELEDQLMVYLQTACRDRVHLSLRGTNSGERLNRESSVEDLEKFYNSLIPFSLLIVCEGSQSLTRELFVRKGAVKVEHLTSKKTTLAVHGSEDKFCELDPADYALGVKLNFPPGQLPSNDASVNVALTVSQTRYLFNIGEYGMNGGAFGAKGYMNMRLTKKEYDSLIGTEAKKMCTFSAPCWVHSVGDKEKDLSLIKDEQLRNDIIAGLELFGVKKHHVQGVNSFLLRPEYVFPPVTPAFAPCPASPLSSPSRFCLDKRFERPGSVIFVGDSCMSHHFWPGRGLNTGLTCGIALVGIMKRAKSFSPFDLGEYVDFVAEMINREMFERSAYLLDPEIRMKENAPTPSPEEEAKIRTEMIARVEKLLKGLQRNDRWPHRQTQDSEIQKAIARGLSSLNGQSLATLQNCPTWPRGKKGLPNLLPPYNLDA